MATNKPAAKKAAPSPKYSIKQLMEMLRKESDPVEKRKLRIKLRSAGHTGGLGEKPGPKGGNAAVGRKAFDKHKAKRAATKKAAKATPVEDEVVED